MTTRNEQGNRRLCTSPAVCTPVTPFPPIGDAAYRQHAGGEPSHRHRQHEQKFSKDRVFRRYPRGQRDAQTDRHTDRRTRQILCNRS